VIATVDGQLITVADVQAELDRRGRGRQGLKERDLLLHQLVTQASVLARAKREGFDQSPEIQRQIRELIVNRYLEAHLPEMATATSVTDVEIERYYQSHLADFLVPDQVRFAVIRFGFSPKAAPEKRTEVRQRAELVLQQARELPATEAGFGELARKFSEDQATRYQGGDAGWVNRTQSTRWDEAVVDAAFSLSGSGALADVVATGDAYYLIRLIERKVQLHQPIEQVRPAIAYRLQLRNRQQTEAKYFDNLKSGQDIEIHSSLLEQLVMPNSSAEIDPPPAPAG